MSEPGKSTSTITEEAKRLVQQASKQWAEGSDADKRALSVLADDASHGDMAANKQLIKDFNIEHLDNLLVLTLSIQCDSYGLPSAFHEAEERVKKHDA